MGVNHKEWNTREGDSFAAHREPRLELAGQDPMAGRREQTLEFGQDQRM